MRNGIGKRFQFLVASGKLDAAFFQVVSSLAKFSLNSASNGAKPRHQGREQGKNYKVRKLARRNINGIKRLHEKIVIADTGERPGHNGRSKAPVPGGHGDCKKEKSVL